MGIGEQFAGLDMSNLIGGPLTAAAEASVLLAQSTADFINQVGFDKNNSIRTAQFKFNRQEPDPDGNITNQEMSVDVPMLAIVPIPNLQIDEVNILFDMEVKQSERSEKSLGVDVGLEGSGKFGPVKVSIKGSVSVNQSNTRSSDNSAKYHVDVRATNHGVPEGLARVLDMMAANVAPSLVGSRPTDPSGNELTGARKERNLKLRSLRERQLQLESAQTAAQDSYAIKLKSIKEQAKARCNAELTKLKAALSKSEAAAEKTEEGKEPDTAEVDKITGQIEATTSFWEDFQSTVESHIQGVAAQTTEGAENPDKPSLEPFYPVSKELKEAWGVEKYDWTALDSGFGDAVAAYSQLRKSTTEVDANRTEYNSTMMAS